MTKKPLGITDVVLRDAHQSILATRVRLEDMLPIAPKLDQVGFWSVESWGPRPEEGHAQHASTNVAAWPEPVGLPALCR